MPAAPTAVSTMTAEQRIAQRPASLPSYEKLYNFEGYEDGAADGIAPVSDVVQPASGSGGGPIYGTTYGGGETPGPSPDPCGRGCGTIYSIDPNHRDAHDKVVWRFHGAPDGAIPVGAVNTVDGAVLGTTAYGGRRDASACPHGCGTVFEFVGSSECILYAFKGGADGANPAGALALGEPGASLPCPSRSASSSASTFYGTTEYGGKPNTGSGDFGTIFSIGPGGYTPLYSFRGSAYGDGAYPVGDLVPVCPKSKGCTALYGVTAKGGLHGSGMLFKLTLSTPATLADVYDFNTADGDYPTGLEPLGGSVPSTLLLVASADGKYDRGSIIAVSTTKYSSGKLQEIWTYAFSGRTLKSDPDGATPYARPHVFKSTLYGTTRGGGTGGVGTVYSMNPSNGSECVLYSFQKSPDGAHPLAALREYDVGGHAYFFGTTADGGKYGQHKGSRVGGGYGTVFEISPTRACESSRHSAKLYDK